MLVLHPRRSTPLSRAAAERLLGGGPGPEPLGQLLAAAAGPGQRDELRGEDAARLAFSASIGVTTAPRPRGRCGRHTARTLSRIMAAKVIAAVALTVGAGSVAVAATTSSFGDTAFGTSTGERSEPAVTGASRPLVVEEASDREAEPSGPAGDTHRSAEAGGRSESCRDGAENGCATPITTPPPSPPNLPPAASAQSTPADVLSSAGHPATRRPSHAPSGTAKEKNERAAGGSSANDARGKRPPTHAAKKTDQADHTSTAGPTDDNP